MNFRILRRNGNVTILAQAGEDDVDEPQAHQQDARDSAACRGATQLALDRAATENENCDTHEATAQEENHGEIKAFCGHLELLVVFAAVDGTDDPGETQTKENIHGVGAGNVSDRRVSIRALAGGSHACKGVGEGGSDGDERDRGDAGLEAHHAAHNAGNFADDGSESTNEGDGCDEARPATSPVRGRAAREEHFPTDGEDVQESVHARDVFNFAVLILGGVQFARVLELLAPGNLFFVIDAFQQLVKRLSLLLLLNISCDLDDGGVFLGDLDSDWIGVVELETEDFVAFLVRELVVEDFDRDGLPALLILVSKL